MIKTLITAAAALLLTGAANAAAVTATVGVQSATSFTLDASDVSGTALRDASSSVAAMPAGTVGNFIAAQPGETAVVTLGSGVTSVSFEWGSPDPTWNTLLVNLSNGTSESFTPITLNLSGDSYVDFAAASGLTISSLTFTSSVPAFEAANFAVTAVPEPGSMALMLAGLGLVGTMVRRRRG